MLITYLDGIAGNSIKIPIAQTARELPLSNYIDYKCAKFELNDWVIKIGDDFSMKKHAYVILLCKCISKYTGVSLVDELDCKYLSSVMDQDLEDHFEELNKKDLPKHLRSVTLGRALTQIFNLIEHYYSQMGPELREYGTEAFQYTYTPQGQEEATTETFYIPTIWTDAMMNRTGFKSLTVKQLSEILDYEYLYQKEIQGEEYANDSTGAWIFRKLISEVAVCALRRTPLGIDEPIPHGTDEFRVWFSDRCNFWKSVDTQTALDIEYWFNGYWDYLSQDPANYYFFNSKEPMDEYEAKARAKMININQEIFEKIRYKGLVNRIFDIGAVRGGVAEVSNMSATEAIGLISVENSKV